MLNLALDKENKVCVVNLQQENILRFSCSSWTKSKGKIEDELFDLFNGYLKTLTDEELNKLDEFYIGCFSVMSQINLNIRELDKELYYLNLSYFSMFNWDKLKEHVYLNGVIDVGIKDEVELGHSSNRTYLTDDYVNLVTFSTLIKGLLPIWGMYFVVTEKIMDSSTKNILKNEHVYMSMLEIIKNDYVINNPGYNKIEAFISTFISDRNGKGFSLGNEVSKGFCIINDISTNDLDSFLMAVALWKKIILFSGVDDIKNIVKDLNHVCNEQFKRVIKNNPTVKKPDEGKGSDDKELTIADTYRIVSTVPPAMIILLEEYAEYPYHCNSIEYPEIEYSGISILEVLTEYLSILVKKKIIDSRAKIKVKELIKFIKGEMYGPSYKSGDYIILQLLDYGISLNFRTSLSKCITDVDDSCPTKDFYKFFDKNSTYIEIKDYHLSILTAVFKNTIHVNLLSSIEYNRLLVYIVSAHILLKHYGYDSLANLIVSNGVERDKYSSDLSNKGSNPVTKGLIDSLTEIYPNGLVCKGMEMINNIAKEVVQYNWNFEIANLKNDLCGLLIKGEQYE